MGCDSLGIFATISGEGFTRQRTNGATDMGETTEIALFESERSKVESWRLHVLIEAGYPLTLAERLAASEADLHRAVGLIDRGCRPETAVEILI